MTQQKAAQVVRRLASGYESAPVDDPFSVELDASVETRPGEGGVEAA